MGVKEQIYSLVDQLPEAAAADVLDYIHWLTTDEETLTDEQLARVQRGEEQIARGEHISLAEVRRRRGE